MEQSVPKRRHIKFRRRGITQKKAYNIQNTAKVWNQEFIFTFTFFTKHAVVLLVTDFDFKCLPPISTPPKLCGPNILQFVRQ